VANHCDARDHRAARRRYRFFSYADATLLHRV
jgi:hypothetical protein